MKFKSLFSILLLTLLGITSLHAKSKSDFPKGMLWSPGSFLRDPWAQDWHTAASDQERRDYWHVQYFGVGDTDYGFEMLDSLNVNWVYQEYMTPQEILGLNRPYFRFTVFRQRIWHKRISIVKV